MANCHKRVSEDGEIVARIMHYPGNETEYNGKFYTSLDYAKKACEMDYLGED